MNKKTLIIGFVSLAVIGTAVYFFTRKKDEDTFEDEDIFDSEGDLTSGSEKSLDTGTGTGTDTDTDTDESKDFESQNIKDLKGSEKRDYRRDVKDICREKYGKGKDYRQCKKRVKKGGVPFDGMYSDITGTNEFEAELLNDI
jgi:hypothetical protein